MNSNTLYLVDPDTGEIIDYINRYSYEYNKGKRGVDIEPNYNFDNE